MFSKICCIIIREHIIQKYKLVRLVLDFNINLGFLSPIVAIEIKKEIILFWESQNQMSGNISVFQRYMHDHAPIEIIMDKTGLWSHNTNPCYHV